MFFRTAAACLRGECCAMVKYCSVPQCTSSARERGVSFHNYPKDPKLKKKWMVKLRMGKRPTPSSTVCSKHFADSDFCYPPYAPLFGKFVTVFKRLANT